MEAQPESENHSNDASLKDAPIDATLDLALDWQDEFIVEIDEEETPLALCQICMEFYGCREVHRNICGPACLAEVCSSCLVQHLSASVYSFYVGMLPKMRCPTCLVALNKAQWKKHVMPSAAPAVATPATDESTEGDSDSQSDEGASTPPPPQQDDSWLRDNSHILAKYEMLCRQSCGFQSPCCHNAEYSMLGRVREDSAVATAKFTLPPAQVNMLPSLGHMYREYCCHRVQVADLYAFIQDNFGANAEYVVTTLVQKTVDDERRANLLLLQLFHHPDTYTTCCNRAVCFKCKSAVHHDGNCSDFVVDENVLDCPGCRVTLVKVDGCSSVTCLCGTSIQWPQEMAKQRRQRKQLAPSDHQVYTHWHEWVGLLKSSLREISNLQATQRKLRMKNLLRNHRSALQRLVDRAVRRARLNLMIREHGERLRSLVRAHLERRKASIAPASKMNSSEPEEEAPCFAVAA